MRPIKKIFVLPALLLSVTSLYAANQLNLKSYHLLNIQTVVSNSTECQKINESLKTLAAKPLYFNFVAQEGKANQWNVTEKNNKVTHHQYALVDQVIDAHSVTRTGIGQFDLNQQTITYVVKVTGDIQQTDFKYIYPLILSADRGHCFYTALLKPDLKTVASFKKNIQNGLAAKGLDLSAN